MSAEGHYYREYDPDFRVAVDEDSVASINAGYRYRHRIPERRSSRQWASGLRLLLPLTAVLSVHFVSVANTAGVGGPSRYAKSFGAIELSYCKLLGVPQPARCGVLEVAENPNQPAGRRLRISVALIPATGGKSLPDPIVILMGGPGEDAIGAAEIYAEQFTTLRQDRDILLVDQRGTGRSGALNCALFSAQEPTVSLRDVFPPAAVERCEQNLRVGADLTQYTYDRFANDLEQVRQALGYGPLNLYAGSYGTRAAQVYLRMYPRRNKLRSRRCWTRAPEISPVKLRSLTCERSFARYPRVSPRDQCASPHRDTPAPCRCIAVGLQSGFARNFIDPEAPQHYPG